jgi:hypothetical protein
VTRWFKLARVGLAAFLVAGTASACRDAAAPIPRAPLAVVTGVDVVPSRTFDGLPVPEAARAREVAARVLEASGTFVTSAGAFVPDAARYRASVTIVEANPGGAWRGRARVVVEMSLRADPRPEGSTVELRARGEADGEATTRGGVLQELAERAVERAAERLVQRHALAARPAAELLPMLADATVDAELKRWLVELLGERRAGEAVPAIAPLLRSDDPATARGALLALARIGHPAAVAPLVDLMDLEDDTLTREVVDAVATIGGADAQAFLFTLSTGHPTVRIREAASAALATVERRAGHAVTAAVDAPAETAIRGGR